MGVYSMDLRTRVLADWDAGMKAEVVAANTAVSGARFHRLVQRRREPGEMVRDIRRSFARARWRSSRIACARW
jgi:hypothetical protein